MSKKLFIFEMANNHMGDLQHGRRIIEEFSIVKDKFPEFDYGLKFQFRDLDTFIHPDYKDRLDVKYVKRFKETSLTHDEFAELRDLAVDRGFIPICTGFDERSIDKIEEIGFATIKIASCSFTDWPLLNRIADTDLPIIASTAGSRIEDIDNVVSFFLNRNKDLTLMHCIGEYPTKAENLQLNQIKFLQERYDGIKIGYSTHEDPGSFDIVPIAMGMGAEVFEKHVGVATEEYELNAYSADPDGVSRWLAAASRASEMCGISDGRHKSTEKEMSDLRTFKRGVFSNRDIKAGDVIKHADVYYAFPCHEGQVLANEMSKYTEYVAKVDIGIDESMQHDGVDSSDLREDILNIRNKVRRLILESGAVIPKNSPLEISHHYGVDNFYETGLCMVTVVNEGYCKKLLISLPDQIHPTQWHNHKTETFVVLYGEVILLLDDEEYVLGPGEVVTIEPGVRHCFIGGKEGCVIEEISTTHFANDSYYDDVSINENLNRKTIVTHWMD